MAADCGRERSCGFKVKHIGQGTETSFASSRSKGRKDRNVMLADEIARLAAAMVEGGVPPVTMREYPCRSAGVFPAERLPAGRSTTRHLNRLFHESGRR